MKGLEVCELLAELLKEFIADDERFLSVVVVDFSEETGVPLVVIVVCPDLVLTTGVCEVSSSVDKKTDDVLLIVTEKDEV